MEQKEMTRQEQHDIVYRRCICEYGTQPQIDMWRSLVSVKKAKRTDRKRPVSEMLLMMFRSAARERRE